MRSEPAAAAARTGPNQVWSYDFVFDPAPNGQQFKCLTVVDEWTNEGLAIDVAGSIRSGASSRCCRAGQHAGAPKLLRSDNGPEFVSRALLRWIADAGIETTLIDPGKPWQNGTNESFNGKFRDECLTMEWFRNRREARADRAMATALQRGPAAFEPRLPDPQRVREEDPVDINPGQGGDSQLTTRPETSGR